MKKKKMKVGQKLEPEKNKILDMVKLLAIIKYFYG